MVVSYGKTMVTKRPTIIDIAKSLNISSASVSRALRGIGKVGPDLKSKIVAEAQRIGYSPNPSAQAFRRQTTNLIGLIVPSFFSSQIDDLVTGIQTYSQDRDYGIVLGVSQWNPDKEIELFNFMASKRVEGIIVKSRGTPQSLEKMYQLAQQNTKIVSLLDRIDFPNIYSVVVDNVSGGYIATKHLLELGHVDILYITTAVAKGSKEHVAHFSQDRQIGMLNAYREAGLKRPDGLLVYADVTIAYNHTAETLLKIMDQGITFSAVFAYDDQIAASAVQVLKSRGLRIPQDVSVVGFDDSKIVNDYCEPPLTVVRQPDNLVAKEAVNLVIGSPAQSVAKVNGNVYTVSPELIVRQSTSRVNSNISH